MFSSPAESQSDLFIEKVYLTVEYLASENITLEEYTQNAIERIARTGGSNIEVLPNSQTSINNLPTTTITYARQSDKLPLKQMETFAIKEDSVYIAIYIAERTKFPKFLDTAKKMINSWSIE